MLWGWSSVAVLAAAFAASLGRYVLAYRLHGDDFAMVLHSVPQYMGRNGWVKWFTDGYSHYFVNYPDWPHYRTAYVRPLANVSFLLESLLANRMGDSAYLVVGWAAILISAWLTVGLLRKTTAASGPLAALAGIGVGLSPIWHGAMVSASFATNALAWMFAIASLVALDPAKGPPRGWRLAACLFLQACAIASHDTAVVIPLVSVALLIALSPRAPRLRTLSAYAIPVAWFVAERILLQVSGNADYGLSAMNALGARSLVRIALGWAMTCAVPSSFALWLAVRNALSATAVLALGLAFSANVGVVAGIMSGLRQRFGRERWGLLGALAAASIPALARGGTPRFSGLAFIVCMVVYMRLKGGLKPNWRYVAVLGLVVFSQVALFSLDIISEASELARERRAAGRFFDSTRAAVQARHPDMLVLVNDRAGWYGAYAMLRLAEWPRSDAKVVVLNNLDGPGGSGASHRVRRRGSRLAVEFKLANGQEAFFAGARPDPVTANGGFQYVGFRPGNGRAFEGLNMIGDMVPGSTLVVGYDPKTAEPFPPMWF